MYSCAVSRSFSQDFPNGLSPLIDEFHIPSKEFSKIEPKKIILIKTNGSYAVFTLYKINRKNQALFANL